MMVSCMCFSRLHKAISNVKRKRKTRRFIELSENQLKSFPSKRSKEKKKEKKDEGIEIGLSENQLIIIM